MDVTDEPWAREVARLRDEAAASGEQGNLEAASVAIDAAFALIDADPRREKHMVFISLLCQAAELPMSIKDAVSAAALFKRAHDLALEGRVNGLAAKALWGLAEADLLRGWTDRAEERYASALQLLRNSEDPKEVSLRTSIEEAMVARRPASKPWWKVW